MKPNVLFFFTNAGFSYGKNETVEQGRLRCAKALAKAETEAAEMGLSFRWQLDGMTNREWTDDGEETQTWECSVLLNGKIYASLCGVDFGTGEPWGSDYARVVQAELSIEALENIGSLKAV
jgi:hypothetical protein